MPEPQPAFGRFTHLPAAESEPRDWYEWICEAEDVLAAVRRTGLPARDRLALLDRAAECIEEARRFDNRGD